MKLFFMTASYCLFLEITRQRILFLLLLLSIPLTSMAQRQKSLTDSVKNVVVKLYNQGNMDAIYQMCDPSFQKFARQKHLVQWLKNIRNIQGAFVHAKRTGRSNGFTIYKSDFQNGSMDFLLAVNHLRKITGFVIRPIKKASHAQSNNPLKSHIDSLVEKALRPYIQQNNTVGVSIGVVYGGRLYRYGYGETAKMNHQLPTANTIYEVGSITKTFTATLLAELALQGKCNLDDPVNKYLPDSISILQKNNTQITLKMLANHTSGLPRIPSNLFSVSNMQNPYKNYSDTILSRYLDTVQLRSVPGTHFVYSNLGFGLLGIILERISGLSYEKLLKNYICDPLELNDTRTQLNPKQHSLFVQGYNARGKTAGHWHFKSLAGGGAIRSSVNDMLKYLQAHLHLDTSTILNSAFRLCEKPIFELKNGRIGLAWRTLSHLSGVYWKNGGTGGFRTYCAYNRDKQVAVVVLANSALSVDRAGVELIKTLSVLQ